MEVQQAHQNDDIDTLHDSQVPMSDNCSYTLQQGTDTLENILHEQSEASDSKHTDTISTLIKVNFDNNEMPLQPSLLLNTTSIDPRVNSNAIVSIESILTENQLYTMQNVTKTSISKDQGNLVSLAGKNESALVTAKDASQIALIQSLHDRSKNTIMEIIRTFLGEEDMTIALNQMYQIVQFYHGRALESVDNSFIDVVHECLMILDKAILHGANYNKAVLLQDINKFVGMYALTGKNVTVTPVSAANHSNTDFIKLVEPKSTYFTEKISNTDLNDLTKPKMIKLDLQPTSGMDLSDLTMNPKNPGIQPSLRNTFEVLHTDNVQPPALDYMESDDAVLELPGKVLGSSNDLSDDLMKIIAKSLEKTLQSDDVNYQGQVDIQKHKLSHKTKKAHKNIKPYQRQKPVENNIDISKTTISKRQNQGKTLEVHEEKARPGVLDTPMRELDSLMEDIMGLENDYKRYDIDWKQSQQQPTTVEDGILCIDTIPISTLVKDDVQETPPNLSVNASSPVNNLSEGIFSQVNAGNKCRSVAVDFNSQSNFEIPEVVESYNDNLYHKFVTARSECGRKRARKN